MGARAKANTTAPTAVDTTVSAAGVSVEALSAVSTALGVLPSGDTAQDPAAAVVANADQAGAPASGEQEATGSEQPEPSEQPDQPEQPSLAERLSVLGLDLGSDDMVGLTMLISMEGPSISLSRNDPHRCDPEEAIRLVQARFAKPA